MFWNLMLLACSMFLVVVTWTGVFLTARPVKPYQAPNENSL